MPAPKAHTAAAAASLLAALPAAAQLQTYEVALDLSALFATDDHANLTLNLSDYAHGFESGSIELTSVAWDVAAGTDDGFSISFSETTGDQSFVTLSSNFFAGTRVDDRSAGDLDLNRFNAALELGADNLIDITLTRGDLLDSGLWNNPDGQIFLRFSGTNSPVPAPTTAALAAAAGLATARRRRA